MTDVPMSFSIVPQMILVEVSKNERQGDHKFSYKGNHPPTVLSTCRESPMIAGSIYPCLPSKSKPIYTCHKRDTLRFIGWEVLGIHAFYKLCARQGRLNRSFDICVAMKLRSHVEGSQVSSITEGQSD
jgi:hypothetical protein